MSEQAEKPYPLPKAKTRSEKVLPQPISTQTAIEHRYGAGLSVVVPSLTGDVAPLRRSLERQSYTNYHLHVVAGVRPAALARNRGAAVTDGEYILFMDDDAEFGHDHVLERMLSCIAEDATIGVVGPAKTIPPGASWLQRRIAREVPRWQSPVVGADTESNPPLGTYGFTDITTTCCVIRRSVFDEVGGFIDTLPTGEDTDFFFRVRAAGYRFVIPANTWVYHPPPASIRRLIEKSFWYGVGHALEARRAPERHMDVIPLGRWPGKLFLLASPLLVMPSAFVNVYFEPKRHIRLGFMPFKAIASYATFCGYTWAWYRGASAWTRYVQADGAVHSALRQ